MSCAKGGLWPSSTPRVCSMCAPACTSRPASWHRAPSSTVSQCCAQFTDSDRRLPSPSKSGTSAAPKDEKVCTCAVPGCDLSMDKRQGVPRTAPDARVSPCPKASSAYAKL
jgi:hypothetical protein